MMVGDDEGDLLQLEGGFLGDGAEWSPPDAGPAVELAPGGTLQLQDQTLRDPESRRRLAESLEAVARWLRNTDTERGGDA